jgi:hypothetical protein
MFEGHLNKLCMSPPCLESVRGKEHQVMGKFCNMSCATFDASVGGEKEV